MSQNTKGVTKIYKCPLCFSRQIDVIIDPDENGIYRCVKCGYNDNFDGLMRNYAEFKKRYRLLGTRLTLEEQRKL